MEEAGFNFRGNGIAEGTGTQAHARLGITRLGIAGLHHEMLDDTVKKKTVIRAILHQFHEIVTVQRGLIIEQKHHVTVVSNHFNTHSLMGDYILFLSSLCITYHSCQQKKCQKIYFFHQR